MKQASHSLPSNQHIKALDGVRGLAILIVIFYHVACKIPEAFHPQDMINKVFFLVVFGLWIGVDLFFVLSGYLITSILLRTRTEDHYFRNFIVRRGLRIFPLYYFFLIAIFLGIQWLPITQSEASAIINSWMWSFSYTYNYYVEFHGWNLIGHIWSLAIEEQFYLLWPSVIFFLGNSKLKIFTLALIPTAILARGLLQNGGHDIGTYTFLFSRMDTLALGAAIAIFTPTWITQWRWRWPACIGAFLGILILVISERNLHHEGLAVLVLPTLSGIIFTFVISIIVANPQSQLTSFFSNNLLRWLGTYSYALYLFHPIVLRYLEHYFMPHINKYHLMFQFFVLLTLTFLATAFFSRLSWVLIEQPFLKLKKYFPSQQETSRKNPHH